MRKILLLILTSSFCLASHATTKNSLDLGFESNIFFSNGTTTNEKFFPSIELNAKSNTIIENDLFDVSIFGKINKESNIDNHFDIRELSWSHIGDNWETKVGISKVFWGITESYNVVNVVNQIDQMESMSGDEKLGQPIVSISTERDYGAFTFMYLPYFRERVFPQKNQRFSLPLDVDNNSGTYNNGNINGLQTDYAFRYSHYIDNLDFAFSYFSGINRTPELILNSEFKLSPLYYKIKQFGAEIQYNHESWFLKLEAASFSYKNSHNTSAVTGFEYTQYGILNSDADLGWMFEILFDDRKNNDLTHPFNRDFFGGIRYVMNDINSTEFIAGVIYDPKSKESITSLEYSRRINSDIKLDVEARFFAGSSLTPNDKTFYFQDEDYIQIQITKYF